MADRGFELGDLLPDGVHCNIPPFLGGRDQPEPDEVLPIRHIATLRIHVERAIEKIKNYQITSFIPVSVCPLVSHIIFTCVFLTLFDPLVPLGDTACTNLMK